MYKLRVYCDIPGDSRLLCSLALDIRNATNTAVVFGTSMMLYILEKYCYYIFVIRINSILLNKIVAKMILT